MNTSGIVQNKLINKACLALLLLGLILAMLLATVKGGHTTDLGGSFDLLHYSLSAGSAAWTSGGGYSSTGALGQYDSGAAAGGGFTLVGGVLPAPVDATQKIYLPWLTRH